MSIEVRVPTLGESVTEATVATWFKKPGDAVAVDEMLCELETDKVTVEVPSPAAGTLGDIVAKVREKKFTRTSLILVGPVLGSEEFRDSYLYDENKAHVYRPKSKSAKRKTVDSPIAHPAARQNSG